MTSACGRGPSGRVAAERPREQGVRGDVRDQVVGRRAGSSATRRGRPCPRGCGRGGAARAACGRAARSSLAVAQRPGDLDRRAPGAEARRHGPQRGRRLRRGCRGAASSARRSASSSSVSLRRKSRSYGASAVERRHLGARAPGEDRGQAEVVHVLVGDDQQLDVLDRVPVGGERLLELVQRLGRVRARSRSASAASPRSGRR